MNYIGSSPPACASFMIDNAKVHIKSMQNKLFFDMFQIYFGFKF